MIGLFQRFGFAAPFFAVPVLFPSLVAQAQETAPALPDLTYLPGSGRLLSDSVMSYDRFSEAEYQSNVGPTVITIGSLGHVGVSPRPDFSLIDTYRQTSYAATESLRYGVLDGLVVGVAETCRQAQTRDLARNDFESASENSGGCGNPTLSATYRIVGQGDVSAFPVNLDLSAGLAPDLVRGDITRPFLETGGYRGTVDVTISRAFAEISLLGRGGVAWVGKATLRQADTVLSYTAYARPYAELAAQYKPDRALFLTAGARGYAAFDTTERGAASYGGNEYVLIGPHEKVGASYQPEATAAWLAVPDLLSVSLRYSHSFDGERKSYSAVDGVPPEIYRDVSGDTVSLDVRLLLF